jgi:hypothetical protein
MMLTWVAVLYEPDAVPSLPSVILWHHIITFLLLLFPLFRPEFANFTCWDGLTEINTFFLVARRQLPEQFQLLNALYWITFIPFRCALLPDPSLQYCGLDACDISYMICELMPVSLPGV